MKTLIAEISHQKGYCSKPYYFKTDLDLKEGDVVVCDTKNGYAIGYFQKYINKIYADENINDYIKINKWIVSKINKKIEPNENSNYSGKLNCSFCEKSQDDVELIVAGKGVYICNECIELCQEILEKERFDIKEYERLKKKYENKEEFDSHRDCNEDNYNKL